MLVEKRILNREIRIFLSNYPEGVSKNKLILHLTKRGFLTRVTFYNHLDEFIDPKKSYLFSLKQVGKREMCVPTSTTRTINKFEKKIKSAKKLLELISKDKNLGEYIVVCIKMHKPEIQFNEIRLKKTCFRFFDPNDFFESKKSVPSGWKFNVLHNTFARYHIIRELPFFLILYLNKEHSSNFVRRELLPFVNEVSMNCLEILNKDYTNFKHLERKFLQKFLIEKDSREFSFGSSFPVGKQEDKYQFDKFLNLLKIYYYSLSLKHTINTEFNSSKEQSIVYSFMCDFFPKKSIPSDWHDLKSVIKKIL